MEQWRCISLHNRWFIATSNQHVWEVVNGTGTHFSTHAVIGGVSLTNGSSDRGPANATKPAWQTTADGRPPSERAKAKWLC